MFSGIAAWLDNVARDFIATNGAEGVGMLFLALAILISALVASIGYILLPLIGNTYGMGIFLAGWFGIFLIVWFAVTEYGLL